MVGDLLQTVLDLPYFLLRLVDVEERDSPDWDLEQTLDIFSCHLSPDLRSKGCEAFEDGLVDLLLGFHLFDGLIDAFLDEDLLKGLGVQSVLEGTVLELQLRGEHGDELLGVILNDLRDRHRDRVAVADDKKVDRYRHLAVGEGVQRVDDVLGVDSARQRKLDLDVLGGEVVDAGYLDLVLLGRCLYRSDETLGRGTERYFANEDALRITGVELRPHQHLPVAVLIVRDIDEASGREVRIELKLLTAQARFYRLEHLGEVVGENLRRHSDCNPLRPLNEDDRYLRRKGYRLPVSSVIGVFVLGNLGVVENALGERRYAAFDVPRSRRLVAGQDIPEVALFVDE